MRHYIDKDALVAEIERLIELFTIPQYSCEYNNAKADGFREFLSFINTLEVKEVNLKEELDEWIKYGPHTNYPWCTIPDAIKITAEHFFELGMQVSNKAQKGDK